jgi:hypothetical protein
MDAEDGFHGHWDSLDAPPDNGEAQPEI